MPKSQTSIDWKLCLKRTNNEAKVAKSILGMFVKDLNETFPLIQRAWEEENYAELETHIHKLNGGSNYTGIPAMTAILSELHRAMRKPQTSTIAPLLIQLDEEYQRLNAAFKAHDFNGA